MINNPTFTVFSGPMFGTKTSKLLLELERFKYQRKRVMLFKPAIDDRYSGTAVITHSGWSHEAIIVKEGPDVLEALSNAEFPPDVVAVDEAFMIPGIADVLVWLYRTGISIVVSTLDLSYSCKPFREVEKMLPWASCVKKCPAVCTECGRDAFYTHKKQVSADAGEIEVGGTELYEPRCHFHHMAVNNRPKIHDK